MRLSQVRYLLAVAEQGSFTRAAAELHVSQPALSQQIRLLEETLGVQLLDRTGRTVKATDAGKAYIDHVERALRELDAGRRAVHDVESLQSGTLSVAFLPLFTTYLVGPVMQTFHKRHPGIVITLDILAQGALEARLADDTLDIGVAFSETVEEDIAIEQLHEEELCLIVGKDHPSFGRRQMPVAELQETDLALLNTSFVTRPPIDRYLRANAVRPRIVIESNSADSIIAIVRDSSLATIMPEATAREVPGLSAIRVCPSVATRTTSILQRGGGYRSAASRAFIELLKGWDWTC